MPRPNMVLQVRVINGHSAQAQCHEEDEASELVHGRDDKCESRPSPDSAPAEGNWSRSQCCWSIRMSPVNFSVRMSPHGDMGDIHDEPQGSTPGWAAQGRAGREDQQYPRSPRPAPERPTVSTAEGPLHRGGRARVAPPPARPALPPSLDGDP